MNSSNATAAGPEAAEAADLQSSLGLSNVDLMAMVLSDSGLANAEPQWWNASPFGCMLIGLQPRGGWQILQRAMQWGDDALARCFGVDCQAPTLYAYFACSIRNRLEVLASDRFVSPMQGATVGAGWRAGPRFSVKRPTKLIDGSRGGQAFVAEILAPETNKHYSIADQSRVQLLSVLLVGAGLTNEDMLDRYIEEVIPRDFDLSPSLGSVFTRLFIGLLLLSALCMALVVCTWWSLFRENLFETRTSLAWMTKIVSLACWAVGATGLLMFGGNPRVKLVTKKLDAIVRNRILDLIESSEATKPSQPTEQTEELAIEGPESPSIEVEQRIKRGRTDRTLIQIVPPQDSELPINGEKSVVQTSETEAFHAAAHQARINRTTVTIQFGSLHGSIFTPDRGCCVLPISLVERICALDIKTVRPWPWVIGVTWFGLMLLAGVTLQIGGTFAPSFAADVASLSFLLLSSLARGAGVSGSEEWMIPKWKRRANTANGAALLGQYNSRQGNASA